MNIKVIIKQSTDNASLGKICNTDLKTLELPSGRIMNIDHRMHVGDGVWKLWNSNYIIEVEEVGKVTGYAVKNKKMVKKTIKKGKK